MRKLAFPAFAVLVFLSGCGQETPQAPDPRIASPVNVALTAAITEKAKTGPTFDSLLVLRCLLDAIIARFSPEEFEAAGIYAILDTFDADGTMAFCILNARIDQEPPPVPTPTPTPTPVKPGIPDLTGAAPIDLIDNTTYAALEDLFGTIVYGPLVGDAKLKLTLMMSAGKLTGKLLFGFEDTKFWRDMTQNHFDQSGFISTNAFDIIFQDDAVVTRVKAARASNALSNGKFMYRVRSSSDALVHYVYPGPWNTTTQGPRPSTDVAACTPFKWICDSYGNECANQNDVVTPCHDYIDSGVTGVIQVGTFEGNVTDWVK